MSSRRRRRAGFWRRCIGSRRFGG
jgi:hypothetical protein